ncbi:DUF6193 family natural product biosynthesis protein [Streptomyces inusitatus]|nr:DUF6193 family natural product biosynthesis protein [Streptomyces inusitatus]
MTDDDNRTVEEIVTAQWNHLLDTSLGTGTGLDTGLDTGTALIHPDVVRAAHAQKRLRTLFPAVSHGTLFFSTTTELPHTRVGGTVYRQRGGTFLAMGAPGGGHIAETRTLEKAFALVAEALPADIAPVTRGSARAVPRTAPDASPATTP